MIKIKNMNLGHKVIAISALVAFISFFFNWASMKLDAFTKGFASFLDVDTSAITSINGFESSAFLLILLFVYPIICIFKERKLDTTIGSILGGFGILVVFCYFIKFGSIIENQNLSSFGLYLCLLAFIGLIAGTFLQDKTINITKAESTPVTPVQTTPDVTPLSPEAKSEKTKEEEPSEDAKPTIPTSNETKPEA